jgi:iron complex transport system substrate-binding protein
MPRIVTLIASATEIVCALGFEKHLVGRSHECDYPSSVKHLPVCTKPKFNVEGSSRDIDRRVKDIVRDALSVYHVDGEMLRELEPDVIVTQAHCEVCAVSLREVERTVCAWLQACPRLVSLSPNNLADVWKDVELVAEALDARDRGEELIARLQTRIRAVSERAAGLPTRPGVACIEWIDPLMAAGNWVPELVELAGGVNLFGEAGKHSPWMTWDDLRARDPDLIVVMPCGFDIERTVQEMPLMAACEGWADLLAVRNNRVIVADGNQFFNRPGPRLVESLEILAELIHPEAFDFGHRGTGWRSWPQQG